MPKREEGSDTGVIVKTRRKVKRPRLFNVVMHNDDYTTMDFVVHILIDIFHKSHAEATFIMLTIHRQGIGACGEYSRDVAETKVAQVTKLAQEHGHPLMCTMEKA